MEMASEYHGKNHRADTTLKEDQTIDTTFYLTKLLLYIPFNYYCIGTFYVPRLYWIKYKQMFPDSACLLT